MSEINGEAVLRVESVLRAGGDVADVAEAQSHPLTEPVEAIVEESTGRLVYIRKTQTPHGVRLARFIVVGDSLKQFEYDPNL